ncbi:MAG: hydrogenase maturation protease [Deltaproteobacteria bacterium]|nr:hydrogenase maturation protease [Deltaproteobacteria bacterium]
MTAPTLVIGVGNPSRGDDALGPAFVDRAAEELRTFVEGGHLELLTDFQLQVEHALDLIGRARVVFVDALVGGDAPFVWRRVEPARDTTVSTHAMSPAAVLDAHRTVLGDPPEAWVLAIRGERFELGEGLSGVAAGNLESALVFFTATCG